MVSLEPFTKLRPVRLLTTAVDSLHRNLVVRPQTSCRATELEVDGTVVSDAVKSEEVYAVVDLHSFSANLLTGA